jgi:hypothetical protein
MSTRAKCLITLFVLMILDILPLPIVGLIGLYVIIKRPQWFRDLVERLYEEGNKAAVSAEEEL